MRIAGSCHIDQDSVTINGQQQEVHSGNPTWKKDLYTGLEIDYPKFYKMDDLSKMAFLASELLNKEIDFNQYVDEDLVLIFANHQSSYNTDQRFIHSYTEKGNPSPSLFVYTLPNILTGELAIRNKWYGENIFFIIEKFDAQFYIEQIKLYFSKGAKACLCGWVEAVNDKQECFLFLVTNDAGELTTDTLTKLYTRNE